MSAQFTGKLADPEFRRERARRAGLASLTPAARIDQAVSCIGKRAEHLTIDQARRITEIVAQAPALTAEQADRLRGLLPPVRSGGRPA